MQFVLALSQVVVVLAGLFMMSLGVVGLAAPDRAARFLSGFATTPLAHYVELSLRVLAGGSFILHSTKMLMSTVFLVFGWVLLVTTLGLVVLPWRWHMRFAKEAVSRALPYLRPIAMVSLLAGVAIVFAATFARSA